MILAEVSVQLGPTNISKKTGGFEHCLLCDLTLECNSCEAR
jgi:hypothetical protein